MGVIHHFTAFQELTRALLQNLHKGQLPFSGHTPVQIEPNPQQTTVQEKQLSVAKEISHLPLWVNQTTYNLSQINQSSFFSLSLHSPYGIPVYSHSVVIGVFNFCCYLSTGIALCHCMVCLRCHIQSYTVACIENDLYSGCVLRFSILFLLNDLSKRWSPSNRLFFNVVKVCGQLQKGHFS